MKNTDYLSTVVRYIKHNLKKGYTEDALRVALHNQNHSKLEIERAFVLARDEMAREAPVLKTKPVITYETVESPQKPSEEKKSFWKKFFG